MSPKKPKTEMVKLDGTFIKSDGTSHKSNFFKFLELQPDDYSDISFTPEEANRIRMHLSHLSTGASAAIPLTCGGAAVCPFASKCQPEGQTVYTVNRGPVPIEKLDENIDKLWSFHQKQNKIRKKSGYSFKKYSREYQGKILNFQTSTKEYKCTPSHICLAKWREEAFTDKTCVYLMRKGDFWRVGTSFFLKSYSNQDAIGPYFRARAEQADQLWILGVYDTKTEALLAEEYFSVTWGISKSLFLATGNSSGRKKWNGLYAWITQERLDHHHNSLKPTLKKVQDLLSSIGLSICAPIWSKDKRSRRISTRQFLKLHAVNLVPFVGYFDFIDLDGNRVKVDCIKEENYSGKVYSLEVPSYKTYITGGLVTHNCPFVRIDKERRAVDPKAKLVTPVGRACLVETQLLNEWTRLYIKEYEIDEQNFTEFMLVRELSEIELMLWRLNNNISKPENAELVQEVVVGVDKQGNPLTRQEVNAFIEAKERLQNRKSRLVKLMVGDRQEKYKREAALKMKSDDDPSTNAAKLRGQIDRLLTQAKTLDVKLKEAEGNVIDVDSGPTDKAPVQQEKPLTPEDLINEE